MSHAPTKVLLLAALALAGTHQTAHARGVNVSLNPFGLLSGSYTAGVEWRTAQSWTAGPYAHYSRSESDDGASQSVGFGLRADHSFSGQAWSDSWYVSPFASYYKFNIDFEGDAESEYKRASFDVGAINVGATLGYGWFWDSGFNLRLGLGLMNTTITGTIDAERKDGTRDTPDSVDRLSGWLPTGDLIFAWVF